MDGREVLAHIKEDESLKTIPTVILTTSDAEADIVKSYQLQANCYLSKPVQLDAFESLVKSINDFWLTKVKLPRSRKRMSEASMHVSQSQLGRPTSRSALAGVIGTKSHRRRHARRGSLGRRQSRRCPADAGSLPRRQQVHPPARGFRRRGGHGVPEARGASTSMPLARISSCWISTCPRWMAARFSPTSRRMTA